MHRRFKRLASRLQSVSTPWRITFGLLLLLGGALWFLPILGLWMIPLGLLVLSVDFPWARRGYLSIIVRLRKMRDKRREKRRQKSLRKQQGKGED